MNTTALHYDLKYHCDICNGYNSQVRDKYLQSMSLKCVIHILMIFTLSIRYSEQFIENMNVTE